MAFVAVSSGRNRTVVWFGGGLRYLLFIQVREGLREGHKNKSSVVALGEISTGKLNSENEYCSTIS